MSVGYVHVANAHVARLRVCGTTGGIPRGDCSFRLSKVSQKETDGLRDPNRILVETPLLEPSGMAGPEEIAQTVADARGNFCLFGRKQILVARVRESFLGNKADGCTDARMHGCTDGRMHGRTDGRTAWQCR